MFDIAWSELLLIGVLILLVMGPKELPKMMNGIGRMMGKARAFTRQFKAGLDDIARETELDEIRRKANQAATLRPDNMIKSAFDPDGEIKETLGEKIDPGADNPTAKKSGADDTDEVKS